jgi:DNA-binding transcriptional MerR regulator
LPAFPTPSAPPAPPPAPTDSASTGGWGTAYRRYRDEEEVRRERIARGILPPDPVEIEAIEEAATLPKVDARKRLREAARDAAHVAELEARLQALLADIEAIERAAMDAELAELLKGAVQIQNNRNAAAVLTMLGMI